MSAAATSAYASGITRREYMNTGTAASETTSACSGFSHASPVANEPSDSGSPATTG